MDHSRHEPGALHCEPEAGKIRYHSSYYLTGEIRMKKNPGLRMAEDPHSYNGETMGDYLRLEEYSKAWNSATSFAEC